MKFHPFSEIFPLIEGAALDELVADIKANGLREKIWLYDGKILDGRNRFFACQKAKIKPKYRKYSGSDPLAFVVSLNVQRRHLTESQRAMAAARIATMRDGQRKSAASIEAAGISQGEAAESLGVGRSSVQRARKVVEAGSKALQQAVEKGEVSVSKAASVVDLPKSEQLAAATKKPESDTPERWEPDADEEALAEQFEKNYAASLDKIMGSDDKLAAAHAEIKRQAAEIAALTLSRDGYMNGRSEMMRLLKKVQSKNLRLEKELEQIRGSRAA
jgi:transposase